MAKTFRGINQPTRQRSCRFPAIDVDSVTVKSAAKIHLCRQTVLR